MTNMDIYITTVSDILQNAITLFGNHLLKTKISKNSGLFI